MPFNDVIGHRRLVALLAGSIARQSLPPSTLFSGPSGIGKRTVALAAAQLLNCTSRVGEAPIIDACGLCASCTRIARGVHSDVIVVAPGENGSIKIEQVRDLIDRAAYRPFEGQCRVVIIDSADALVAPAQNALLKTLEEPPSASVFILVTAQPDLLLPTVRSRCPQLRFGPLATDDVVAVLRRMGQTDLDARAAAAAADGSVQRALEAMAGAAEESRHVAQQVLASVASSDDPRRRLESAKTLLTPARGSGASDREQMAVHLRAMASLLRDAELLGVGGDTRALANTDVTPALERLAATYRGERGVRAFAAVDRALVALDRNAGVKIVADWLMIEL
jgi:DNA polymerase-3 subunit delta'